MAELFMDQVNESGDPTVRAARVDITGVDGNTDAQVYATLRTFTYGDSGVVGDTIVTCGLPYGRVLHGIDMLTNVALGTTTFDVGTHGEPNKFAADVALTVGEVKNVLNQLWYSEESLKNSVREEVVVTVKTADLPAASDVSGKPASLSVKLLYTMG